MLRLLKILLAVLILGMGVGAAVYFVSTKPTVTRTKPEAKAPRVEVLRTQVQNATITVSAMGTVVPSRELTLRSQVSGNVVSVADQFTPGGRVKQGAPLLSIDPRDYRIALEQKQSAQAQAQASLSLEQGQQEVAREELAMFAQAKELGLRKTELALREPQLQQARADVKSSQAAVRQAQLDLERTRITAPFNALITKREVNLGSFINVQDALATLVDRDTYWVQASVPLESLSLMDLEVPGGRPVRVLSQSGAGEWTGHTLRLTGEVDEATRMATLLIEIPDPLQTSGNGPALMLGDYVRVRIQGRTLQDVVVVPRKVLRDKNTIWVVQDKGLDIRAVHIVWKDATQIYIDQGLAQGEQVIRSELSTPVAGMRVTVAQNGGSK